MAKTKTNNSPIFLMQYINSDALNILGEKYQRELNLNRIAKIVSSFNEMVANEPKVSLRDGSYYVFDGQHTVAARILLNDGKDLPILCKVCICVHFNETSCLYALCIKVGHYFQIKRITNRWSFFYFYIAIFGEVW